MGFVVVIIYIYIVDESENSTLPPYTEMMKSKNMNISRVTDK